MWFIENFDNKASLGIKVKDKIFEEQSKFQLVEIYETEFFGKLLTLDGLVMLSEKDEFVYHEMIVHVPMCSHPNPERVLIIGGGDGGAVRETLKYESVKEVVLCEIDELVVKACKDFMPSVSGSLDDDRVKVVFEDGFKYLDRYDGYFDVILTDSSDPVGPGVELFKRKYFELIRKALKSDGIAVSQSESPWYYEDVMKDHYKEISSVFDITKSYSAFIPLYPSGFWTFAYMSNVHDPMDYDVERAVHIAESCKYYNEDLHSGCFAIPNFLKRITGTE